MEEGIEMGVSPYSSPTGGPGEGDQVMDEEGCSNGASHSEEAHCGGPRGRASLLGTMGYERKALGMGISLHGGSVGQHGVGSSTGDFEIWLKGVLEVECLSLRDLNEENLEGGLSCWRP